VEDTRRKFRTISTIHQIRIVLIGVGGTGSHVLGGLARMDQALKQGYEQHGIHLYAWDPDVVEKHNVGRQTFMVNEIGMYKSDAMIQRCNRAYGTSWDSFPKKFNYDDIPLDTPSQNIDFVITCTDNVASRKYIDEIYRRPTPFNWIDAGNFNVGGQVLASFYPMPTIFDLFSVEEAKKRKPSCSMIESLTQQEFGVNMIMASWVIHYVWTLIHMKHKPIHRGVFINLITGTTNPIKL
jgi:PRTRC genetic system ThiF family protein